MVCGLLVRQADEHGFGAREGSWSLPREPSVHVQEDRVRVEPEVGPRILAPGIW